MIHAVGYNDIKSNSTSTLATQSIGLPLMTIGHSGPTLTQTPHRCELRDITESIVFNTFRCVLDIPGLLSLVYHIPS